MIPIARQYELWGVNRSSLYYRPIGESACNLGLMRLIDIQFTETSFYDVPRIRITNRLNADSRAFGRP